MGALGVFIVTFFFLGVAASRDEFDLTDALFDSTRAPQRNPENQGCPNDARDIVLLIDGSSSIDPREFSELKSFVAHFCRTFPENTLFSLLQFSNKFKEHFDFKGFQNNRNLNNLLRSVSQLGGSSYTATAIMKAVEQFTPQKGARSNAKKFLVVVTDGEKTGDPLEYAEVVQEAARAGITRFAIGVGPIFSTRMALRELHAIASPPVTEHTIVRREFSNLMDNQLTQKICATRGTVVPQPTLASSIPCASCSDQHVLQKLEQVMQALDQLKSKLDMLAARDGKCRQSSHS